MALVQGAPSQKGRIVDGMELDHSECLSKFSPDHTWFEPVAPVEAVVHVVVPPRRFWENVGFA